MKRPFFQTTALVVVSVIVLPLFAQPARADDSVILRSAPSFDPRAHATTLSLCGGWINGKPLSYIIKDASDVNGARKLGVVYSPDPASVGNRATRHVAKLGDRYVFEGGTGGFSPESFNPRSVGGYSPFVRVGGIAGALNAPTFASGSERSYAQTGYSPLLNMQELPADNAPRVTDFARFAAQGAYLQGFLVNYSDVVRIIRL
jgi:hypothetical protein